MVATSYPIRQVATNGATTGSSLKKVFGLAPLEGSTFLLFHHTGATASNPPAGFQEDATLTNTVESDEGALYSKIAAADTITNASQANPCEITVSAAHDLTTGDDVWIDGIVGMTELNGRQFTITKTGATTFTLDGENSTTHPEYTSGGTSMQMSVTALSGASDENMMVIAEVPGEWAVSYVDQVSEDVREASVSSYAIAATGMTAQANELALAFMIMRTNTTNNVSAWSDNFIDLGQVTSGSNKSLAVGFKRLAATQTVSCTATMVTANTCMGAIVTLKRKDATLPAPGSESGLWEEITTDTLISIDPEDNAATNANHPADATYHGVAGQSQVVAAWCGGCIRQTASVCQYILLLGGGHDDYYGNECYKLDILAGSPTWELLRAPYDNDPIPLGETDGMYAAGEPASRHTYNYTVYDPDNDEVMMLGGKAIAGNPAVNTLTAINFEFTGNTWSETTWSDPSSNLSGLWHSHDVGDNDRVALIGDLNNFWAVFSKNSNSYTEHGSGNSNKQGCSCFDPVRQRVVVVGYHATDIALYDVNIGGRYQEVTTTSAPTGLNSAQFGILYDSNLDRYVGWNGGTVLYDLDPDTFVWSTRTLPTQTVTPTNPTANGTYNRWAFIEPRTEYPDGAYIIVNATNESTYLFAADNSGGGGGGGGGGMPIPLINRRRRAA